jgi:hypothetical protein
VSRTELVIELLKWLSPLRSALISWEGVGRPGKAACAFAPDGLAARSLAAWDQLVGNGERACGGRPPAAYPPVYFTLQYMVFDGEWIGKP